MRTVIQLDREPDSKIGVHRDEIDMLLSDPVELGIIASPRDEKIGNPNLSENPQALVLQEPLESPVKLDLCKG